MTHHGRVRMVWSQDRVALLASGREVYMTQGGVSYVHSMQVTCCAGMKNLLSTPTGRKLSRGMTVCPYCKKELAMNGHARPFSAKSEACRKAMKGRYRVYENGKGSKWHWSKRADGVTDVPTT